MTIRRNGFRRLSLCLVATIGAFGVTGELVGEVFSLQATIDGAQANMGIGTGSSGTGVATMSLDTESDLFSWNISWSGLTGSETVMHFHGPASAGVNANVRLNFGDISGTSSPSIGSEMLSNDFQDELLAGLWYINIHSSAFPGGEIRGQVELVPEPASAGLLGIGLVWAVALTRRRRQAIVA